MHVMLSRCSYDPRPQGRRSEAVERKQFPHTSSVYRCRPVPRKIITDGGVFRWNPGNWEPQADAWVGSDNGQAAVAVAGDHAPPVRVHLRAVSRTHPDNRQSSVAGPRYQLSYASRFTFPPSEWAGCSSTAPYGTTARLAGLAPGSDSGRHQFNLATADPSVEISKSDDTN